MSLVSTSTEAWFFCSSCAVTSTCVPLDRVPNPLGWRAFEGCVYCPECRIRLCIDGHPLSAAEGLT